MKRTEFTRKMRQAGWSVVRQGGSHEIWGKKSFRFAVPRHNEIKDGIVRDWEKVNEEADKS
ncbi:MAG: hypothetical protein AMXMBFR33_01280 [Candidatus Xenobia bacterium]